MVEWEWQGRDLQSLSRKAKEKNRQIHRPDLNACEGCKCHHEGFTVRGTGTGAGSSEFLFLINLDVEAETKGHSVAMCEGLTDEGRCVG